MKTITIKNSVLSGGFLALLSLIALNISGCSRSSGPEFAVPVELAAVFEGPQLSSNVARVELWVTAGDIILINTEVPFESGRVNVTVDIPPGQNISFSLGAYGSQERLLYFGNAEANVGLGEDVTVLIQMVPQILMLKVNPLFQSVSPNTDDIKYFDIYVYRVENLFGASFRIEYNNNVIVPTEVQVGDFLGPDAVSTVRMDSNFVAVALTLTQGQPAVTGSGWLARIFFDPLSEGVSPLNFNPTTAMLTDAAGAPVNGFANLVLENGDVEVTVLPEP
ncbi:MAG TPA: hypothetical protein ENO22_14690 [candidate division Zixibacteria bacterium]|nr:hypothetical protein [candidate division Zixibacteria bacterium]